MGPLGWFYGVVHVWAARVGWVVEIDDPGALDEKRRFGCVVPTGLAPMTREEVIAWAQTQPE